jgi:hypothetical protein
LNLLSKIADMQASGASSSAISQKFLQEVRPIMMKGCMVPFLCAAPGKERIRSDCKARIRKVKNQVSDMFGNLQAASAVKTAAVLPLVNGLDMYLQLDLTQTALMTASAAMMAQPPNMDAAMAAVGAQGMAMLASAVTTPDAQRAVFASAVLAMTSQSEINLEGDMDGIKKASCKKEGGDKYVKLGWVQKRPETLEEHWCFVPDQCHDSLHHFYTQQCEKEKGKIEKKLDKCIQKTVSTALGAVPQQGGVLPTIDPSDVSTMSLFVNMAIFKGIGEMMTPLFNQLEDGMHECFEEHLGCGSIKAMGEA